jgi:hypothetical protein
VLLLGRARPAHVLWAAAGAASVVAAFTVAGFDWLTGYHLVGERYYQGLAAHRPYAYWIGANLTVLAVSAGPVTAVILRRAALQGRRLTADVRIHALRPQPERQHAEQPHAAQPHAAQPHAAQPHAVQPQSALPHVRRPHAGQPHVGQRHAGQPHPGQPHAGQPHAGWLLAGSAALAIAAADLSGYSKAEVERIWLPFAVWLLAGAGLLPTGNRRAWLAAQAVVALLVNHLLLTVW